MWTVLALATLVALPAVEVMLLVTSLRRRRLVGWRCNAARDEAPVVYWVGLLIAAGVTAVTCVFCCAMLAVLTPIVWNEWFG